MLWRDGTKEHSPLASALCSDPHAIRTVANYVYHRFDIRLATLGLFLMKRFARVGNIIRGVALKYNKTKIH